MLTHENYDSLDIGDVIVVQVASVGKTPYSIRGKDDAILISEEGIFAYIPSNEYSMYKNFIPNPEEVPGLIFKTEVIDKYSDDGQQVIVLSLRNTQRKRLNIVLEELKEAEFVPAQIIGFNNFGALLTYKGLVLLMTNASFINGNKPLHISNILEKGDVIDVRFHKIKKRGREIRVLPLVTLPTPSWNKKMDTKDLSLGSVVKGKVYKITPQYIYITIGRSDNGMKVGGTAYHPVDDMLDSVISEGVEVMVSVTGVADNGYVYMTIEDIITDSPFESKMEYYKEVENFYA